jgi:hypothetical protein
MADRVGLAVSATLAFYCQQMPCPLRHDPTSLFCPFGARAGPHVDPVGAACLPMLRRSGRAPDAPPCRSGMGGGGLSVGGHVDPASPAASLTLVGLGWRSSCPQQCSPPPDPHPSIGVVVALKGWSLDPLGSARLPTPLSFCIRWRYGCLGPRCAFLGSHMPS